ncbi:MAG: FAD-dependent oxidoreductase [Patescibacteria group bacterium]
MTYEAIIIGGGPAGLTAAIYCARKNLRTLLLTKDIGGQAVLSQDIENYLGFTMITGQDLVQHFRDHLAAFKDIVTVQEGVAVTSLDRTDDTTFRITVDNGTTYDSHVVIIASGRKPRWLGVPGEEEFKGRGVAVCATCDGAFFKGKDVAVIGGGNSAMDAAITMAKFCKTVHIVVANPALQGDEIFKHKIAANPNIVVHGNAKTLAVEGDQRVTGLSVMIDGIAQVLTVAGVFVEIGWLPSADFDHVAPHDKQGAVLVDRDGQTGIPGLYAAGDVNDLWGEQIIIAAGEGAKVAMLASQYINKLQQK